MPDVGSNPSLARWQLDALETLQHEASVVVAGQTGSGKSTVARWAWSALAPESGWTALFIAPSAFERDQAVHASVDAGAVALTNRSLRSGLEETGRMPSLAATSAQVLSSTSSARILRSARWDFVVLDAVDRWPQAARDQASILLRETSPQHVLVTAEPDAKLENLAPGHVALIAPAPVAIGQIAALRYRETKPERDLRARAAALRSFAGDEGETLGLETVVGAAASSPYATQDAALKLLADLRPARDAAAHTRRHSPEDALLLAVVLGLEIVVDEVDDLESDSRRARLLQALDEELSQRRRILVLTSQLATSEYLLSGLRLYGVDAAAPMESSADLEARVVIVHDDLLDSLVLPDSDAVVHFDTPNADVVSQRVRSVRAALGRSPAQWALVPSGDRRARAALRAAQQS